MSGESPPAEPRDRAARALWTLFALGAAASLWLAVRGRDVLPDKPFVEDSFYALGAARNLGTGHGLSIDGVTPTNGVQPLWVVALAPIYAFAGEDRVAPLRVVLLFEWALWVLTALGVAALARRVAAAAGGARLAAPLAALAWIGSGHLWRQSFNGLETGLALALLVAVGLVWTRRPDWTLGRSIAFGALLGLAVLARIDAVFLVAIACAAIALHQGTPGERLGRAATAGIVAVAVSLPWWAYNQIVFGSVMPTSGQATAGSHLDLGGISWIADATATGLCPNLWLWDRGEPALAVVRGLAAVALVAFIVRRAAVARRSSEHAAVGSWAFVMLAFTAALTAWYVSQSRMVFFYGRYLAPAAVVGVPFAAAAVASRLRGGAAVLGGALLAAAAAAYPVACSVPSLRAGNVLLIDQVGLVTEHVPPGETVAALQTGTLSYFHHPVVNLDGKVNAEILALRTKMTRDAYMRMRGVRWFCDDEVQALRAVGRKPDEMGWDLVATRNRFGLWRRRD